MPKAAVLQGSFNSGELSPLLYGRTEAPAYKKGLDTCLNYIPTLQGPLSRRPGSKFLNAVKDSTKPPVLVPFQFSLTQAYILEFGDGYIRFYANNGQIVTTADAYKVRGIYGFGHFVFYATRHTNTNLDINSQPIESILSSTAVPSGSILELQSPYSYADLSTIKWTQNADTLYLTHPSYPPYKLQREGQEFWSLSQVYFQDGPYLPLNSYAKFADSTNVTLHLETTSAPRPIQTGPSYVISGMVTDPLGTGAIQVTTSTDHTYINGQKIFISGVVGTTEANNWTIVSNPTHPTYWKINVTSSTTFVLIGSTFTNAYVSDGATFPALFWDSAEATKNSTVDPNQYRSIALDIGGARYWATFFTNSCVCASIMNSLLGNGPPSSGGSGVEFPSTDVATSWQMGVWCPALGFPSCATFHQNRLALAGTPNFPQEVDLSNTGSYELFSPSNATTLAVADNNALQFTLSSDQSNQLQWLKSTAQALLAGSANAEWAMSPSSLSDALTPTNFNAQQTSFYGSANIDAVLMGNAAIYIQRGQRKVREMNFFFQVGTFRSTDLTELSEHITNPGITKIVVQKETQPLLWATRSDGALLSMIYNRDDVSIQAGWTRHLLAGQSDSSGTQPVVQSMAIIPSTDLTFDQLWMTVLRYINGTNVVCIEYLTKIYDDLTLQEDAFQCDCGGTYDVPKTITGISTANPAVVTSNSHGFSNGDKVRIVSVVGLGKTTTDINGNRTTTNLVNETTFVVAGVATNTFQLNDFSGNAIDSTTYGAYVSGGQVRKLVSTISNLTWLEGETVGVLTDGGIHPDCVVSNTGAITLNYPAAKVQIGYRFKSQGKLLRAEAGAADGTSIGKTRRTTRAAIQMHRIGDMSLGTSFDQLIPLEFPRADSQKADEATPLFSGIVRDGLESAIDFESQVCFEQSSMLPGSVQSITSFVEEQDV